MEEKTNNLCTSIVGKGSTAVDIKNCRECS